jgi:hypothetical protein
MTEITNRAIRNALRLWVNRSGWTFPEIVRGQRGIGQSAVLSADSLRKFASGPGVTIRHDQLLAINRFITDHPAPGDADAFIKDIAARYALTKAADENAIMTKRIENERRRAEHVRRHLEREHQPKRPERGVLFGLPKDVVAALSGISR